jgi:hypothetical protein
MFTSSAMQEKGSYSVKMPHKSLEIEAKLKYLGTKVIEQNYTTIST